MKPKDWTLLVVAAGKGQALTPVQLQKALFLLGKNLSSKQLRVADFYPFRAYDYGPFNAQVYSDAKHLRDEGLIIIDPMDAVRYRYYSATVAGSERSEQLRAELRADVRDYLDRVVAWVRSLSFTALVQAIYRDYPEMKANSVFRE
jgi:uncharacterized phage-associated protein